MNDSTDRNYREVNFDGLVGPTHNYSGLAFGNVAATNHEGARSSPKQAALQGLEQMWALHAWAPCLRAVLQDATKGACALSKACKVGKVGQAVLQHLYLCCVLHGDRKRSDCKLCAQASCLHQTSRTRTF